MLYEQIMMRTAAWFLCLDIILNIAAYMFTPGNNTRHLAFIITVFYLFTAGPCVSQNKYWVSFTVKTASTMDPDTFFDQKTLDNRILHGLPLTDWYDLPVDGGFVTKVTQLADSSGYTSRWLNGIAVYATAAEINKISGFSFVKNVRQMNNIGSPAAAGIAEDSTGWPARVSDQLNGMQGTLMAAHGLSGKGIRIAVLDVGFQNVDKHPAFQYLRDHKGIVMTYDFLHKKENVYNYGSHGTAVLSCIAGKYHGLAMGLAPDAEFLLARTERAATEYKDEEDAWVAAAEWAEQHGAQMISCSLGYTYQRYFYKDMNGRTSVAARGAAIAARKGLLICIAAGNEGEDNWKFITTPGDCDSVLTVGGYDPKTGFHSGFSSYGPSADGRLKPNVIAAGTAWVATPAGYGVEDGTSFATPLVAGYAACVWQYLKNKSNMQILDTIQKTGSLYPYFDYAHGYGIPQASRLFGNRKSNDTAFSMKVDGIIVTISIAPSYFTDTISRVPHLKNNYLYAKLTDPTGRIKDYELIKVNSQKFDLMGINHYLGHDWIKENGTIPIKDVDDMISKVYPKGWTLSVLFDGCLKTYTF